jgi:hypothetical protein
MVRSQGYMTNSGHLAVLRADGEVAYTHEVEGGRKHEDVKIGVIESFDPTNGEFIAFEIAITESKWTIRFGSIEHTIRVNDLPYVFADGRILIESQFCWVCIRNLSIAIMEQPSGNGIVPGAK